MWKKKKRVIQVAGNPLYRTNVNRNQNLINPKTGTPLFGQYPAIATTRVQFEAGPIYLRYGEHHFTGHGWGMEHIWKARFASALTAEDALPLVTGLVGKIITPGATIHYEFGTGSAAGRCSIFRSPTGIAIVERRFDGMNQIFYSVVTAIETTKVNGPIIGSI
jgi:hypothetical protein